MEELAIQRSNQAYLVLADGTSFQGKAFGDVSQLTTSGEVVFNTAMSGYQEVLTDPSYRGQLVCMTYPLIGNYGINDTDNESKQIYLSGFIVKELSRVVSNYRATTDVSSFLKKHRIVGIEGIDTRFLTLKLREHGALQGAIVLNKNLIKPTTTKLRSFSMIGSNLVNEVAVKSKYQWNNRGKYKIVVLDTGIKYNILRSLEHLNCKLVVMPPTSSIEEILAEKPDGIFLANGPGDPAAVDYVVNTTKRLLEMNLQIFGICLGHQLLASALGAKTYKLKFGHHGANHPVKNLSTGRIEITSQNHGFAVNTKHLPDDIEITHVNLNDHTCEGLRSLRFPAFSVQYHPESAPGPHDSQYLFNQFVDNIKKAKATAHA